MRKAGLMVGFSAILPYHVMRCAVESGTSIHVLGDSRAARLQRSRFCSGYHNLSIDQDFDCDLVVREIRSLTAQYGFDFVLPSDDVSTRLLATIKDAIGVPTSAIPSPESFDALNDKWRFSILCRDCDVRTPASRIYENPDELRRDLEGDSLQYPVTVKPINLSGSIGIHHVLSRGDLGLLERLDYRPIIAQQFVRGRDVGINLLCRNGEVVAYAVQERDGRSFRLFENTEMVASAGRIARVANLHGPANFDAVIEHGTGRVFFLECNPRFWYTIYLSMVLGRNFVAMSRQLGIEDRVDILPLSGTSVRLNKALLPGLIKPWTYRAQDWRMLGYHLRDPLPYIDEKRPSREGASSGSCCASRSVIPGPAARATAMP